jgi:glycosyltransferase involved in cell wall biosynthesis
VPAKGVDQLIKAFRGVNGDALLRIWGRPEGQLTAALRSLAGNDARVEWRSEYDNANIVRDVLNCCDAIVVPSIWYEFANAVRSLHALGSA